MADIIALLPDHVANQIAAGEVIQRPSSAVKELIENAVDAGATEIQLIVKDAGKTLIQVIDNGKGMSPTDLRMAFERHATSKIRLAEDLFQLDTKGFRGEALASIAAVAHVEAHSRPKDAEVASSIQIEGTTVVSQEVSVAPKGTSIAIKKLFFNIPARRNFLKTDAVELRHIIDEFQRVALAHPDLAFSLLHNGSELFDLPKANLKRRLSQVMGGKFEEKIVAIEEETPLVQIKGYLVKPNFAKKSRGQQFFFVNQRFIKSPFLHHALCAAFEGLLKDGYQPGYFIFLQVSPEHIDINIHPTKTEIKFEDEQSLYAILKSAVKHSLGMFQVTPALDFDRDPTMDPSYATTQSSPKMPSIEVDASFNPFQDKKERPAKQTAQWDSLYAGLQSESVASPSLGMDVPQESSKVFQLFQKYIVSSLRSGLLVIDQQRAHQRVLYEQFLNHLTGQPSPRQQLLFPLHKELAPHERVLLESHQDTIAALGFEIEWEDSQLTIKGIPAICSESQIDEVLEALLSMEEQAIESYSPSDLMAKIMAKTLSIKSGKILEHQEQDRLINDLFACKETQVSPFNRQIFVTLEKDELEKKFN
ncbi:MAG: DNA mismatch repair endonuclease MutL [Flavobacteriales bacterium]|nr:DNA mismatch repair endonuclease MutL [Flavobacteriales bacterium]